MNDDDTAARALLSDGYRCGPPPKSGALIEDAPHRWPSRFPVALQPLLDRYEDPNADGALFLAAAACAIEDGWAYVDGRRLNTGSDAGTGTVYYALESLARWQKHERLPLSADLHERFTDLSAAVRQYFRVEPSDPPPIPDPPLECLLVEVGWLVEALVLEVGAGFRVDG